MSGGEGNLPHQKNFQKSLKKLLTGFLLCGIMRMCQGEGPRSPNAKHQKKFQEPLDKLHKVWYNQDVPPKGSKIKDREGKPKKNQKGETI